MDIQDSSSWPECDLPHGEHKEASTVEIETLFTSPASPAHRQQIQPIVDISSPPSTYPASSQDFCKQTTSTANINTLQVPRTNPSKTMCMKVVYRTLCYACAQPIVSVAPFTIDECPKVLRGEKCDGMTSTNQDRIADASRGGGCCASCVLDSKEDAKDKKAGVPVDPSFDFSAT